MSQPLRYGAIIETDFGILTVQERQCKAISRQLCKLLQKIENVLNQEFGEFDNKANFLAYLTDLIAESKKVLSLEERIKRLQEKSEKKDLEDLKFKKNFQRNNLLDDVTAFINSLEISNSRDQIFNQNLTKLINTIKIVIDGKYSLPGGTADAGDYSPEHTVIREVQEELGLKVKRLLPLVKIERKTVRQHQIYLVSVDGKVQLNPQEISGINFINKSNIIPVNNLFYQNHLVELNRLYIRKKMLNPNLIKLAENFKSNIEVPFNLLEDSFKKQFFASHLRSKPQRFLPNFPSKTPNFSIDYSK